MNPKVLVASLRRFLRASGLAISWLVVMGVQSPLWADILDVTNLFAVGPGGGCPAGCLEEVNTSTNAITTIFAPPGGGPDSLIFAPGNKIVYTLVNQGEIGIFTRGTSMNTLVGGFGQPRDLALEPSQTSVLVGDFTAGSIKRVDLGTFVVSTLGSGYGGVDGITYDNSGLLFAVIGGTSSAEGSGTRVAQIDPITGAVLNSISGFTGLDGITFDPVTGALWVSDRTFSGLRKFPTNLAGSTLFAAGLIPVPDGLESNGAGNIFVASQGNRIFEYNITGNTTTGLTVVTGLDDLAPLVGLGAPPAVPEPFGSDLLGVGILAFLGYGGVRTSTRKGRR